MSQPSAPLTPHQEAQRAQDRRREIVIFSAALFAVGSFAAGIASYYYYWMLPLRAPAAFQAGVLALAPNHYEEALSEFNRALQLDPELKGVYLRRALAYQNLGKLDQALEDFERALGENPRQPEVFTARAQIYRARGQSQKAMEDLSKALAIREDTDTYFERARTYQVLGDYPQAIADLDRVIHDLRDAPHALRLRASLKQKVGDLAGAADDTAEAQAFEERGVAGTRKIQ